MYKEFALVDMEVNPTEKQIKLFLSFNNQGHAVIKEYKKLSIFSGPSQQYSYNTPPAIRIPQTINFFTYRTI